MSWSRTKPEDTKNQRVPLPSNFSIIICRTTLLLELGRILDMCEMSLTDPKLPAVWEVKSALLSTYADAKLKIE
jgi:hypothetical protein